MEELIKTFNNIVKEYKMPLIVSTHPRTLKSLEKFKFLRKSDELVKWHQPFGLIDFIKLQLDSFCVISDSGTIHEDSAILKFPALAIRNSTEKYESLDSGYCPIIGLNSENVLKMIKVVTDNFPDLAPFFYSKCLQSIKSLKQSYKYYSRFKKYCKLQYMAGKK